MSLIIDIVPLDVYELNEIIYQNQFFAWSMSYYYDLGKKLLTIVLISQGDRSLNSISLEYIHDYKWFLINWQILPFSYFLNIGLQDLFNELGGFFLIAVVYLTITQRQFFWKLESRDAFSGLTDVNQLHQQKVPMKRYSKLGSYSTFVGTALDRNCFSIFLSQCRLPNSYVLCRHLIQVNDK